MNTAKPFSEKVLYSMFTGLAGEDSYVFLESTRLTSENRLSYLFVKPVQRLICRTGDDPAVFFREAQEFLRQGYYLAGYVAYEFGYLLEPVLAKSFKPRPVSSNLPVSLPQADLGVFPPPLIYDHMAQRAAGERAWPAEMPDAARDFTIANLHLNMTREQYLTAIRQIKSYIEAGDTYQVNYTLKLLFGFSGSLAGFYCSLRRNQSVSYSGVIKKGATAILTFSPELFFRKSGSEINVRPMKGTMPRGRTAAEDRDLVDLLQNDIKNRSENVMIVDLLRNDLGRLSRMGGVGVQSLFDVETYETLHQMTSSIRGELGRPVSLSEMFRALFPCGSVTGAPKIRTMEIIRELEVEDRGVYTGAIGFVAPDGAAVFNVPIRTVLLQGDRGEMGIGSGIVWDSDPVGEWDECNLKGRFLTTSAPEFKLIETILWQPKSGYWLLDLHLDRLRESAAYFAFPLDPASVRRLLQEEAGNFDSGRVAENKRVRLILSRDGEMTVSHSGLSNQKQAVVHPAVIMQEGAGAESQEVVFSSRRTDSSSVFLFHKTTMRHLYDAERARVVNGRGFYEVVFENEKGEVTEGSYTNIFMQKDGRLMTPPVSCGLLPGVFRHHLLQQYPGLVVEKKFTRADLAKADAVYVGNSVRGLVRVCIRPDPDEVPPEL